MPFELPSLPYKTTDLEPHIDAKTMEIHHGKHHAGYVNLANSTLTGTQWANMTCEQIFKILGDLPDDKRTPTRNSVGGHANHSLFWNILSPKGGGEPAGELAKAINRDFGSFADYQQKFAAAAMSRFGSGWAWLGCKSGKLCVCSTPNQDNPLMTGFVDCECTPILGLDVWEHAYYLNYQNRRADYVSAFWNIVNWQQVAENFTKACS